MVVDDLRLVDAWDGERGCAAEGGGEAEAWADVGMNGTNEVALMQGIYTGKGGGRDRGLRGEMRAMGELLKTRSLCLFTARLSARCACSVISRSTL